MARPPRIQVRWVPQRRVQLGMRLSPNRPGFVVICLCLKSMNGQWCSSKATDLAWSVGIHVIGSAWSAQTSPWCIGTFAKAARTTYHAMSNITTPCDTVLPVLKVPNANGKSLPLKQSKLIPKQWRKYATLLLLQMQPYCRRLHRLTTSFSSVYLLSFFEIFSTSSSVAIVLAEHHHNLFVLSFVPPIICCAFMIANSKANSTLITRALSSNNLWGDKSSHHKKLGRA